MNDTISIDNRLKIKFEDVDKALDIQLRNCIVTPSVRMEYSVKEKIVIMPDGMKELEMTIKWSLLKDLLKNGLKDLDKHFSNEQHRQFFSVFKL